MPNIKLVSIATGLNKVKVFCLVGQGHLVAKVDFNRKTFSKETYM